jgi:hypothetical protein
MSSGKILVEASYIERYTEEIHLIKISGTRNISNYCHTHTHTHTPQAQGTFPIIVTHTHTHTHTHTPEQNVPENLQFQKHLVDTQ